jgi:curved DNA-binding protein CbpA
VATTPGSHEQGERRGSAGGTVAFDPDAEDYYQLLGVPYGATAAEIDRAYRAAMRGVHPDRQRPERRAAAEELAKRLNLAYATLAKPPRRLAYDRTIRARVIQDQIMSRYVGGFAGPAANGADRGGGHLRRPATAAERRERADADRTALVSLLVVFGAVALAVVAALVVWAVAGALFGAVF